MSDHTKALRYKRPALASMGAQEIMLELESVVEACDNVRYYIEQADSDETLLNALDGDEEDYFSLTSYEENLAHTEAGKRLCRLTKAEMISRIGWAFGIMLAFFDLRQQYDYLRATFDILRDENTSLLGIIKDIEKAYDEMEADNFREWADSTRHFDQMLAALPDRAWLE